MGYGEGVRALIGDNIARLRKSKGIGQREFAELLGVSQPYVSIIETGKRQVSDEQMYKLLNYFDVSEKQLLYGPIVDLDEKQIKELLTLVNQFHEVSVEFASMAKVLLNGFFNWNEEEKIVLLKACLQILNGKHHRTIDEMKFIPKCQTYIKNHENKNSIGDEVQLSE